MHKENTFTQGLLGRLFGRYLAGQIADPVWSRFMSALDAFDSRPTDRQAFITFVHDALMGGEYPREQLLSNLLPETVPA